MKAKKIVVSTSNTPGANPDEARMMLVNPSMVVTLLMPQLSPVDLRLLGEHYSVEHLPEAKKKKELRSRLARSLADMARQVDVSEFGHSTISQIARVMISNIIDRHLTTTDGPQSSLEKIFDFETTGAPNSTARIRIDMESINDELIKRLAKNPEIMRELHHRKFEELIAKLMEDRGYTVELTPRSKDGGRDIIAIYRSDIGQALTLIECKKYAENRPVGVEVVRSLYGVVSQENVTRGMIATTSHFTKGAIDFRNSISYRMDLAGFDTLKAMLTNHKSYLQGFETLRSESEILKALARIRLHRKSD